MFNISRSIYWKITLPFIIVVLAGMALLGFYMVNSIKNIQINNLKGYLLNEALMAGDVSRSDFTATDGEGLETLAKMIGSDINARVTFIATDGTVLGDTNQDPASMGNYSSRPEVIAAIQSGTGEATRRSAILGDNTMYAAVPVKDNGNIVGVVRVSLPLTEIERSVNSVAAAVAGGTALATLVVIIAAALITRMITRPVRRMTKAADEISMGKLGGTITVTTDDEIGRLGHAFNEMSAGLKTIIAEVNKERNKLDTVLNGITDGVMMTDPEGMILLVNPAVENLFDINKEKVINKSVIEAFQDHEIDNVVGSCLKTHKEHNAQLSLISGRFLRIIAVPVSSGESIGALVVFQDLTELRSLQTMRREFIGNISHELRTPLAGIKAIVDTLRDGAINDRKNAMKFLDRLDVEVDGMTQMVNELTELSRIETGSTNFKFEPSNLNMLVDEVVRRLSHLAERKQINIIKAPAKELPLVPADKERIKQVVVNILHNAIKFTPAGGSITISTEYTVDSVLIHISDTGAGIASADLPHIFERFFKADKSRSSGGTGLGLAIAKHIIQTHNGKIWAHSEPGKGSTFSFSLPLERH